MKTKLKKVLLMFSVLIIALSCMAIGVNAASYYESESNDSYDTADTLAPGNSISGTINQGGDNDYYKITAPANGKISISFGHTYSDYDSSKYWEVWIYQYANGSYNELSYKKIYSSDNEKISFPYIGAVKNGVYYIKVYSYYGDIAGHNYKISTSFTQSEYYERENNGSYSTANKLTLGKTYNGTISKSGDNDYYKIVSPINGTISVKFRHNQTNYGNRKHWEVWIYQYANGAYNELAYKKINSSDSATISFPNIGAKKNGVYYIKVYSYYGDIAGENYKITASVYLSTPKLKAANTDKGARVTWDKVKGASGYYVYKKNSSGKWQKIATTSSTGYTDTNVKAGKTYTYTVKAYYGSSVSGYSKSGISVKRLIAPKLTGVTSSKSGITVKWGKVTGASGYYVYRKTGNGDWKKIATVKGNSKVSYLDKSAKKGTTYAYTVRAYSGQSVSYYNTTGLKIKDRY